MIYESVLLDGDAPNEKKFSGQIAWTHLEIILADPGYLVRWNEGLGDECDNGI